MGRPVGDKPYCLVLSGGGSKGVYHIGVSRALRELGVPVHAYVGNSIGSLIAAFLVQGLYNELEELGATIGLDSILDIGSGTGQPGVGKVGIIAKLKKVSRSIASKGGLDTSPLRSLLERHIDEQAIRASGVDFGVMTVNVSDLAPAGIYLGEMEEGCLVDYLMASSAVPGFELPKIRGKTYMDGGVYDNLPYEMARRRGYRRIIVVDISGFGFNAKANVEGSETVYIKNSINMGGLLDFNRKTLDDFLRLGYLDTMRTFGRLAGYSYFLSPDEGAELRFRAAAEEGALPAESLKSTKGFFPERMRHDRRLLLKTLECAASSLRVERIREYTYAELGAEIERKRIVEDARAAEEAGSGKAWAGKRLERFLLNAWKRGRIDRSPYFYAHLARATPEGAAREAVFMLLWRMFSELRAAQAFFRLDKILLSEVLDPGRRDTAI